MAVIVLQIEVLGQLTEGVVELDAVLVVFLHKKVFWEVLHGRVLLNDRSFVAQASVLRLAKTSYLPRKIRRL